MISFWSQTEATDRPPPPRARLSGPAVGLAPAAAYAYIVLSVLPVAANGALGLLALASVLAADAGVRPARGDGGLLLALVVFGLSVALSTATSVDVARSLRLSVPLVPGMLLFLLIGGTFRRAHVRGLYAVLAAVALGTAAHLVAVAWSDPHAGPATWIDATETTLFVVPNDVGFFAAILPLSLALALGAPGRGVRVLGLLAALAEVVVVVCYRSRGAALTVLVVLATWAVCARRRAALAVAGAVVVVMLAVDAGTGFPLTARFIETWASRASFWVSAWSMFRDAPLLGHGPRSFGVLLPEYAGTVQLPSWLPPDPRFAPWAHNLYLETLAEQGMAGLAALLFLVATSARAARRLVRTAPAGEPRALAVGAALGLLAMWLQGLFELSFVRLWVVVVLFALFGAVAALAADPVDDDA